MEETEQQQQHSSGSEAYSSCLLKSFMGSLSDESVIPFLPPSMDILTVSLSANIVRTFFSCEAAKSVLCLNVHMTREIEPSNLPMLHNPIDGLYLSGIGDDDIRWVVRVTDNLQGSERWSYWNLRFPDSEMSFKGAKSLLHSLAAAKIWVAGAVFVSTKHINMMEKIILQGYSHRLLGCQFFIEDDENIWNSGQ